MLDIVIHARMLASKLKWYIRSLFCNEWSLGLEMISFHFDNFFFPLTKHVFSALRKEPFSSAFRPERETCTYCCLHLNSPIAGFLYAHNTYMLAVISNKCAFHCSSFSRRLPLRGKIPDFFAFFLSFFLPRLFAARVSSRASKRSPFS